MPAADFQRRISKLERHNERRRAVSQKTAPSATEQAPSAAAKSPAKRQTQQPYTQRSTNATRAFVERKRRSVSQPRPAVERRTPHSFTPPERRKPSSAREPARRDSLRASTAAVSSSSSPFSASALKFHHSRQRPKQQRQEQQEKKELSPDRPNSTTSRAAQIRKNRLYKLQKLQQLKDQQQNQPTSDTKKSPVSPRQRSQDLLSTKSDPTELSPKVQLHTFSQHSNLSPASSSLQGSSPGSINRTLQTKHPLLTQRLIGLAHQHKSPHSPRSPRSPKSIAVAERLRQERRQRQQDSLPRTRTTTHATMNHERSNHETTRQRLHNYYKNKPDETTDDEMTQTNVHQLMKYDENQYYDDDVKIVSSSEHEKDTAFSMSNSAFSDGLFPTKKKSVSSSTMHMLRDDDDTYDYGAESEYEDTDTNSQGSLSYAERQRIQKEEKARQQAVQAAHNEIRDEQRLGRTAAGLAAAATVGCLIMGPVGLLVGAAAVGIGVGYMQIPEQERANMNEKASEALNSFQETALNASEKLSNSCATTYKDSGVSDHVPVEIQTCCTNLATFDEPQTVETRSIVDTSETDYVEPQKRSKPERPTSPRKLKRGKVACLRTGKVLPLTQIYCLDPSSQPRAWLDILASADTRYDEKIEATEEVLILAKDKHKSRIFVEEGILDCLLWTIGRYMEKRKRGPGSEHWKHPNVTREELTMAKLAANLCLTLGKSYCAAIHTEGDLLLMSLYNRGTVPEERQLAQMLLEVPHHERATKTDDPTVVANESFVLTTLTLSQAEELAANIQAISEGRL